MIENNSQPLISIIIVTYNSSKYVIEALESAKAQTYKNIELIITDDGSSDNTTEICEQWIYENKDRFSRTKIVKSITNTGIAINANRGLYVAEGEWLKFSAGDDILMPNCIETNHDFVEKNSQAKFLFSNIIYFKVINEEKVYLERAPLEDQKKMFNCDPATQFLNLLQGNFNWLTPSSFMHRETLISIGGFDERYPSVEDYPLWLKCTRNNLSLSYVDIDTFLYRQSDSITRTSDFWMNKSYFESLRDHFESEVGDHLKAHNKKLFRSKRLFFYHHHILINTFKNKKSLGARLFNIIFPKIFR